FEPEGPRSHHDDKYVRSPNVRGRWAGGARFRGARAPELVPGRHPAHRTTGGFRREVDSTGTGAVDHAGNRARFLALSNVRETTYRFHDAIGFEPERLILSAQAKGLGMRGPPHSTALTGPFTLNPPCHRTALSGPSGDLIASSPGLRPGLTESALQAEIG